MGGPLRPGIWISPRLQIWVEDLPWYAHVISTLVGTLLGYIYAASTGTPAETGLFCGAVAGACFLLMLPRLVGLVVTAGLLGGFLLIIYNVFFVPDGAPWRLLSIDWRPPKPPAPVAAETPLANQQVYSTLRVAFAPSTNQISDPRIRMMALSQIDGFAAKGYQLIRCNYGEPSPETGSYPAYYDFWYQDSPVLHPDFPRLPPARIAVLHYFPVLKCPATEREAGELWSLALAIRNEDIARNMRNAQQGMR